MSQAPIQRRLPIGAEIMPQGGVHFRVWAPDRRRVEVILEAGPGSASAVVLRRERGGYFGGIAPGGGAGTRYRFRLDGGAERYPDPASRFQPEGPHGPSEVIDPGAFRWSDSAFRGAALPGQIIYELHVGTFTEEGTWAAAERELPALAELGITLLEVMPVADFPGRFNWGYDGVNLFAPTRLYGTVDDFRGFVDAAHRLGMGVILDVVYNHLGPDGNYLASFAKDYFSTRHGTPWGAAINFDGPRAAAVREYFLANAGYWIDELHLDGLRLDATDCIHDSSEEHILTAIGRRVREAARGRATIVVAEEGIRLADMIRAPEAFGHGLDAVWSDDFHHSARVALTGKRRGYYADHRGSPQELISAVRWGSLFQGQRCQRHHQRRGQPLRGAPPARLVFYLENHDQVSNTPSGARLSALASPGRLRALTALLLLSPATPMLFQGQEIGARSPFVFFADHRPDLAAQVFRGRAGHVASFYALTMDEVLAQLPDPASAATFALCKLPARARPKNTAAAILHRDLIALRRRDPVISAQRPVDGAVLSSEAFLLRYFDEAAGDRLLLINLGPDLDEASSSEPLLAPPSRQRWKTLWSSEDARYGGHGITTVNIDDGVFLPGASAVLLGAVPA